MIGWCLCNTAVATVSWASVDLDGFLKRTAWGVELAGGRAGRRVVGKRQPARCSRKTQDKFAIASMAKKLLHCCIGAHARVHMHFLRRVCTHWQVLLSTMQVCTLDRCCEHQCTHLLHARYRMCICYRYGDIYIYVCICIYIYIYIYVYVHIYAYVYIYVSIYICMCMCIYMQTYIYVCMYACVYVHVYMYVYMYIYESICIFAGSMYAFTGVVEHHTCTGVYVRQMLWTSDVVNISVHIFFMLATGCAYALCIYMCICICIRIYIYVCMYVYMYVCM